MSQNHKTVRPGLKALTGVAAVIGLLLSTMAFAGAQAAPVVVFDAIGPSLPPNVQSQPFQGSGLNVNEVGDLVTLAPGPRNLTKVSVVLSSQACETGSGTPECTTPEPAPTFDHPITVTLYNVAGTSDAPTVGSEIASVTQTKSIPLRPSADPEACTDDPTRWQDDDGECHTGVAVVVDFVFPEGTVLPDDLIWAVSYNTQTGGYEPVGEAGPWDQLNVGASSFALTIGTDVDDNSAFLSSDETEGQLLIEEGWEGMRPMARIEVQELTTDVPVTTDPTVPGDAPDPTDPAGTSGSATAGAPLSFAG